MYILFDIKILLLIIIEIGLRVLFQILVGNPFLPRFRESYLILRTKENREEGEWVTR